MLKKAFNLLSVMAFAIALSGCSPKAPVDVRFKQSNWFSGRYLVLNNTSDKSLSCRLIMKSEVANQKKDWVFSLAPYAEQEIGVPESGWNFMTGETGKIEVEGHSDITFTVP